MQLCFKNKIFLGTMSNTLPQFITFMLSKNFSYPEVQLSLAILATPPRVGGHDFKIISKFLLIISIHLTYILKRILPLKTHSEDTYITVSMGSRVLKM